MTWQRIDENTYIDDTLVTCAEYQLFIDEMFKQEKYYQPDHWNSYQFPKGQGREPILGVRHSDAVTFCSWLTKREKSEWIYRLPNPEEANNYLTRLFSGQLPLGCWIRSDDKQANFLWIGSTPKDARRIDFSSILTGFLNGELNYLPNFDLEQDLISILNRGMALDIERAMARALKTDHDSIRSVFFKNRDFNLKYAVSSAKHLAIGPYYSDAIEPVGTSPLELDLTLTFHATRGSDDARNLFFDIFTLQERIAGRSPAFEGIRLVKERMR